jgi:tetratricopeptide (TPR) repeat protein
MDRGPARAFLGRASHVGALCWVGACLADALQYAHERGLVHLDLKPSNVLMAADGQPMLLDFHLARGPFRAGETTPAWLGGTRGYMSPEQQAALAAVRAGRPVPAAVDGRSDVYSLGLLLYEALGGPLPSSAGELLPRLCRCNRQVSVGLSDLIHKCLAPEPRRRYPDAGALAEDLRRHANDLPLKGVRNRSLRERWQKWRRRRPHALGLAGLRLLILAILLGAAVAGLAYREQRVREARAALAEGEQRLRLQEYPEAVRTLSRGLDIAGSLPGGHDLARDLDAQLRRAKRGQAAGDLHLLAEKVRFLLVDDPLPLASLRALDERCGRVWEERSFLVDRSGGELDLETEGRIAEDLLDLALFWSDLRQRMRGEDPLKGELQPASRIGEGSAQLAREHYARGRALLRSGQLAEAAAELERAVGLQPQGFWPTFYQGVCAYRLQRYADAVSSFRVCIALAPQRAECYCNRGLAWDRQGQAASALADYDRALRLDPTLAAAALNRGILHYCDGRLAQAEADLGRAADSGADLAAVHYNLALVHWARKDRPAALASLKQALAQDPTHARARELQARLQGMR